jgi:hypothetical protein
MAASESETPGWQRLVAAADLVTPMAVRVAATLRLADLVGEGVEQVETLAERTGTNADALGRVLRQLICHGIFTEPEPGRLALNDAAEALRSDDPSGVRAWFDLSGFSGRMDLVFAELMHTVRTGQPAWEAAYGVTFWEYLADNPTLAASFDAMMSDSPRITAAAGYDWSGVRHVADVGGGTGALLAAVLHANPEMRGTLIDFPDTVTRARTILAAAGLEDRCAFAGQSFFEALPAGADAYVLSGVVHDWGDAEATAILRRCSEAAGADGRVLIAESHGTAGDNPAMFAEMDLRMLVLAGGRERSVEQYGALAAAAGLQVAAVESTPTGHVLIDCRTA